jgi:hypothetical protein
MIFLDIFAEKLGKNICVFLLQLLLVLKKNGDHNIGLWEKRQFFRRSSGVAVQLLKKNSYCTNELAWVGVRAKLQFQFLRTGLRIQSYNNLLRCYCFLLIFFVANAFISPFNTQTMHIKSSLYTTALPCFPENLISWRDSNTGLLVLEADAKITVLLLWRLAYVVRFKTLVTVARVVNRHMYSSFVSFGTFFFFQLV